MLIVLPFSDRDQRQAMRVLKWIGYLSSRNGNSMLEESILLVASQRAARHALFKQICWMAARIFREARCHVPDTEYEKGWPASANWMFKEALFHTERYLHDDIFWLEPDAIPIRPSWYDEIQADYQVAKQNGKSFLGALVPHNVTHMTGIAVYPSNWRQIAPTLAECPDHDAFDCYSAHQVLPNLHQTALVQHVFKRHDPGWAVPGLGIVDRRAAVFHQDKQGKLIHLLDAAYFNSECIDHPLFGFRHLHGQDIVMRKFYYAGNATLPKTSHGMSFSFDKLDPFGGAIPGVFTTEIEQEQIGLADLTSNPTTGVTEISQEEWEQLTKKKLPPRPSDTSKPLNSSVPSASILATPSKSPAVLVAEPSGRGSEDVTPGTAAPIKDIGEVLKTDVVVPSQPNTSMGRSARPRKPVAQPQ